ncbi:hypothetical protein ACFYXS_39025 [Streptomyces sp. NPDC002574]|uniref:hypothetical protein n=1 Tax=Streptomyces sp. NPDC002574 TaxID=3364652 RepID=UPI0036A23EB9
MGAALLGGLVAGDDDAVAGPVVEAALPDGPVVDGTEDAEFAPGLVDAGAQRFHAVEDLVQLAHVVCPFGVKGGGGHPFSSARVRHWAATSMLA